ncbi:MAG: heme-binding protein, partial [Caulobacteraceae bacterium]|nr:heme-binding protein [Caulobacteraceae bacterium]
MKYVLLGVIFAALLIASRAKATEQPSYTASQQSGPIEVRQYGSMVAAEVSVTGDRDTASSAGFRALAGYIFGGNSGKKSIAMTAPVVQAQAQGKGQSIAMTAPVMQTGDGKEWTVRFIMPKAMTMQNLPTPNNPQVKLVPLKPESFAAIRFSGMAKEADIQRQTKLLQDYMT